MVNEVLRLLRVYNDIKSSELAEKLDLSSSYISELESGKKKASIDIINKYSAFFEIPSSSILLMSESLDDQKQNLKYKISRALINMLQNLEKNAAVETI
ncbi:MAG: helix-turn-helix transcriptional regulator [Treponema sp.]|nr:helix-turn-helix transcriptional regulator [Treponema sp.]